MRLAIEQTGGLPSIDFQVSEAARAIFGEHEENLRAIEDVLKVKLSTRGTKLFIDGQSHDVVMVRKLLEQIRELQEAGHFIDAGDVGHAAQMLASGRVEQLTDPAPLAFDEAGMLGAF